MFPIFDVDGKPVAFGGRVLPGGDGPKYKNSQDGPLYSKRRVLYGLNWSKEEIARTGEVIVCEGYTDVIAFQRAGVNRAVATCGTALADEHMARLKNFARRIILAYDADAAGQGAAERFYTWEQRLELDIHVLGLPPGADPGSTDADKLRDAVASARPFLEFRIGRILDVADLTTAEGRARAADRALAAIAAHPDDLVRDQYVMTVADRCRIGDADRLRVRLDELRRTPGARQTNGERPGAPRDDDPGPQERGPRATSPPRSVPHAVEIEALRLAVHRPEQVAHLLEPILFDDEVHRAALACLLDAPTLGEALERADPDAQQLLYRLAVEEPDAETEADDVIAILVRSAAQRRVAEIDVDARASQQLVDLRWPKARMEELGDSTRRVDASAQLVAWLCRAGEESA